MGFIGVRCARRWRTRCRRRSARSSRPAPKLGAYRSVIEDWLVADARVPRKQRHTARRIWQRLVEEYGAEVSERQVDRYVAVARRRLGEVEAFVPLVAGAGVEAEVDWGQAQVLLRSAPVMVRVFLMRACHSGASFAVRSAARPSRHFWGPRARVRVVRRHI